MVEAFKQIRQDVHLEGETVRAWSTGTAAAERLGQYSVEQQISQTLLYDGMDNRPAIISPEHAKTFAWLLDDSYEASATKVGTTANFSERVPSNEHLYWVSGKPGSGKLTLMKYISSHYRYNPAFENLGWR